MKKRALAFLLLISMVLQPMTSILATETEAPTVSSEEKETENTLERPLDTMTQELLESEPTTEEEVNNAETPTERTDSIGEPEAPIDIEPPAPTPETLSAPRAVITVPWGQTICTIEGEQNPGYTITVRAGSGTIAGTPDQAPWKTNENYKVHTKKIIFDGSGGKIQLVGDQSNLFGSDNSFNIVNMETIKFLGIDTSRVTNMRWMFNGCHKLRNLDVSGFDTSQVVDMGGMFNGCNVLPNLDLSSFDTRSVTDMSYMFNGCSKLPKLDLSSFDTSRVTNMGDMFAGCSSLTNLDLSNFDTRSVTNMQYMFNYCPMLPNLDVSHFDTSRVTNMSNMFKDCQSLSSLNVSHFDTRQVTNMSYMFYYCQSLTDIDVSSFSTGTQIKKVGRMSNMFAYCTSLVRLDLSSLVIKKKCFRINSCRYH